MTNKKQMSKTFKMSIVALFAALTAVGAFIKIPLPAVPFTLQFLFCALSGILLGSKLGFRSQLLYVGIGLVGVPVFTKGGGIGYVFQPTFGYLVGFIAAGFIIGKIIESVKKITAVNVFIASTVGLFVVYLLGVPYLYMAFAKFLKSPISVSKALSWGFFASIGGDMVICIILAVVSPAIITALKKSGYSFYSK